jgi:hypothetical protein
MNEKIRLNDEQWKKLLSVPNQDKIKPQGEPSHGCSRLRSYGLLAHDSEGREYLTEKGIHRLGQGR